uniref:Uncharacterized protein n=1 Tax=Arundo donax TaxID=35708 RepID=A0A0A9FZX1_ARUDO
MAKYSGDYLTLFCYTEK